MGLVETKYYHLECNGPAAVPWEKHCSNKFPGNWDEEKLTASAIFHGWDPSGRSWFCPAHAPTAPAESNGEAPARKRRQKTVQLPEGNVEPEQEPAQ